MSGVFARISAQVEALSTRDRRLLTAMASFGMIAFVTLFWYFLSGILDDRASRVIEAKKRLAVVQDLEQEYQKAAQQISSAESRLGAYTGQPFAAHAEKIAANNAVTEGLRAVQEAGSETVGSIRQTHYKVELKGISYGDANNFLYELETSGYPVTVQSARYKSVKRKDETLVDLSIEVVVSKLSEG